MTTRLDLQVPVGGTALTAWHYVADAPRAGLCVVMAHGFCGTRDAGLIGFCERFAAAGIDVLCFDYRGFGASGGEPRQDVDIDRQLADYDAAIAAARCLDGISRVAIWGTSLSGAHVFSLVTSRADLAAAIAMTPITDALRTALRLRSHAVSRMTLVSRACRDAVRAAGNQPSIMVPATAEPGAIGFLTSPGAASGYHAATRHAPLWLNAVTARTLFRLLRYRPGHRIGPTPCPLLVQIGTVDVDAPPDLAAAAAIRANAQLRSYRGVGHFDVYDNGPAFETVVADQISFLLRPE